MNDGKNDVEFSPACTLDARLALTVSLSSLFHVIAFHVAVVCTFVTVSLELSPRRELQNPEPHTPSSPFVAPPNITSFPPTTRAQRIFLTAAVIVKDETMGFSFANAEARDKWIQQ